MSYQRRGRSFPLFILLFLLAFATIHIMKDKIVEVGWLSKNIIDKLNITNIPVNTPIYLGPSNINHMLNSHPSDYNKYKDYISEIINTPNYGYLNSKDNSIELIKDFINEWEHVRAAIRISNNKQLFLRTLFTITDKKLKNYINHKKLIVFN